MQLTYSKYIVPKPNELIELYENAGLKRPTGDEERIRKMIENANLIITCYDGEKLVGVSRSLTDFSWCCYLADLAIREGYKQQGIGKELIALTKRAVGDNSMVLLLSVDTALEYYPKVGMDKVQNGFIINRTN